ncbi:MAG: hypothetical protein WCI54_18425 [Bacteroidia bacterium]|jgi:hypothetical protein
MDTSKLKVVVSEQYSDDLKNIFQYGLETFGYASAFLFYDNIERLIANSSGFLSPFIFAESL